MTSCDFDGSGSNIENGSEKLDWSSFGQANWYAFGKLTWNPDMLLSEKSLRMDDFWSKSYC
jgi:alpha-glucuronidase